MIRSRRLEAPPATNIATPRRVRLGQRRRMATRKGRNKNPFPAPKTAVWAPSGQSAPRLKKPRFLDVSRRNVSARNDRLGVSESLVAATCLVTRSQPIVAPIARSKTRQTPVFVIIALRKPVRAASVLIRTMAMGKRIRDRQPTPNDGVTNDPARVAGVVNDQVLSQRQVRGIGTDVHRMDAACRGICGRDSQAVRSETRKETKRGDGFLDRRRLVQ